MTYSGPKHFTLNHSDNCDVQIYGTKVRGVDIETDFEAREISSYKVAIEFRMRSIFIDKSSYCNCRWTNVLTIANTVTYHYLMFDFGHLDVRDGLQGVTFDNYLIN